MTPIIALVLFHERHAILGLSNSTDFADLTVNKFQVLHFQPSLTVRWMFHIILVMPRTRMPPSPYGTSTDPWTPAKAIVTTPTPPTPRSLICLNSKHSPHTTSSPILPHTTTHQPIHPTTTHTNYTPTQIQHIHSNPQITPSLTHNGKLRTRRRERRLRRRRRRRQPVQWHGQDYRPGYALPFPLLLPTSLFQIIFSVHRAPLV